MIRVANNIDLSCDECTQKESELARARVVIGVLREEMNKLADYGTPEETFHLYRTQYVYQMRIAREALAKADAIEKGKEGI